MEKLVIDVNYILPNTSGHLLVYYSSIRFWSFSIKKATE
jgi:hypothetical protein